MIKISIERIEQAIFLIRGQKVLLDADLAQLYGVETQKQRGGRRYLPHAFTEQGVAMLLKPILALFAPSCG